GVVAALGVAWCLPWLVPAALVGGVAADADGAAAFALADDSGLGAWLSALMGGGVWATGAQPPSRQDPVSVTASLALVTVAVGGIALLGPGHRSVAPSAPAPRPWARAARSRVAA